MSSSASYLPPVVLPVVAEATATTAVPQKGMDFQIAGPERDLVFVNGRALLVRGPDARRQRIDIALRHMMGEWFLDENAGTDYFGKILGKSRDLTRRAEIRRRILSVPGVVEVQAMLLTLDPRTRALSGTATALDITGAPIDVNIEGVT